MLLWGLSVQAPQALSAQPDNTNQRSLYTFGRHLLHLGNYYRAITELKRFSLLFPKHSRYPAAQILLGIALQEQGHTEHALAQFQRIREAYPQTEIDRLGTFKLGEIRFLQQQYRQATAAFEYFLKRFPEGPLTARTTYFLGLSLALNQQPNDAQRVFNTLPPQSHWAELATTFQTSLQNSLIPPTKSLRTAGILAGLLPGAGHLYIGKPRHAITAFFLNILFITGSIFAFLDGLEATGVILLYFETGWYLGNIKSAMEGASAFNQRHQQVVRDQLHARHTPLPLNLQELQAPGLGLRLSF